MRAHRFVILASLSLFCLSSPPWVPELESGPELPAVVQGIEGPPWHTLHSAWQIQALHEARRDRLVNKMGINEDLAMDIALLANREASRYGIPTSRILALIIVESRGNPDVVSHAGAVGLMQILPGTGKFIARQINHEWTGPRLLKDVETNITFGTWYYTYLLRRFGGDQHAALAAYNWGPGHIQGRIRNAEKLPQVYPRKVYLAEEELQREVQNEYRIRYWRGFDSFVNRARECVHAGGSYAECGLVWYPITDEEGLYAGTGQIISSVRPSFR